MTDIFRQLIKNNINTDTKRIIFENTENDKFAEYLTELAKNNNIFAKYQQIYDKTGLPINLKALLKRDNCKHVKRIGNAEFKPRGLTTPQIEANFVITEEICLLCGKTVKINVQKLEKPKRLFKN